MHSTVEVASGAAPAVCSLADEDRVQVPPPLSPSPLYRPLSPVLHQLGRIEERVGT